MVDGQGWAYLLTRQAFEQGLREGSGHYSVLYRRRIALTSMLTSPTHDCQPCLVLRSAA